MTVKRKSIYLDLLDTVRTSSLNPDKRKTIEARYIGAANLMLSVLIGENPVISQTHAFDSSVILGSIQSSIDSSALRSLVRRCFIRIKLFRQPDLISAFISALNNPNFLFSGWPEIEEKQIDRVAIIDYLNGNKTKSFTDDVLARLDAIERLNSDMRNSKFTEDAKIPKIMLKDYTRMIASVRNSELHDIFIKLNDLNSNDRSLYYKTLDDLEINETKRETAREIIDMLYNAVISNSLGVDFISLTSSKQEAIKNVKKVLTEKSITREPFMADNVKGLNQLDWNTIEEFLRKSESLNFDEFYFEKLYELLAITHAGKPGVAFIPKIYSNIFQSIEAAGIIGLTTKLTFTPTLAVMMCVGFIGNLLTNVLNVPISDMIKKIQIKDLKKRYKGLIQGVKYE